MGKIVKPDKETLRKDFNSYKKDFLAAIKDKKRWISCLIEIGIMCLLLAVDLLTKHYVYGHCETQGDIVIIDGVIRFTAVKNTGASFGIFKNATTALTVVSLICSIILILFIFYSYPRKNKWLRSALVMITAGALGNVIDRLHFGYVRDMVYFELIDFAVFNFADSCLTIGTVVLIIYIIFFYSKEEESINKKKEEAEYAKTVEALLAEPDEENAESSNKEKAEEKLGNNVGNEAENVAEERAKTVDKVENNDENSNNDEDLGK